MVFAPQNPMLPNKSKLLVPMLDCTGKIKIKDKLVSKLLERGQ
jgi:hypothetical protein